jgi:ABC-2 type transport system permease protein
VSALLRAELIKLSTTRTFVVLVAAAVATSLLITILVATLSEPSEDDVLTDVFLTDTSSLFVVILAIIGIAGEWRHRTITSSLLAAPHRVRFLAAKLLAYSIAGLVLSAAVSLAAAVVGWAVLSARDLPLPEFGDLAEQIGRTVPVALLPGAFGVALGSVLRNPTVAIVTVLLLGFAIEPTLAALAPDVARFGPTSMLPAAVSGLEPEDVGVDDVDFLSAGVALLALLAWIGGLFALGAVLLKVRDLD